MRPMKRAAFLVIVGVAFWIVAILLALNSEVKLDRSTAQAVGVDSVANFQATIFAIGCGIVGAINFVGGLIIATLDDISRSE